MTTKVRLALFGSGLALVFTLSWMLGSAFAPAGVPADSPPATTGEPHESDH